MEVISMMPMSFDDWKTAYDSRKAVLVELLKQDTAEAQAMIAMISHTVDQMTDRLSEEDQSQAALYILTK